MKDVAMIKVQKKDKVTTSCKFYFSNVYLLTFYKQTFHYKNHRKKAFLLCVSPYDS